MGFIVAIATIMLLLSHCCVWLCHWYCMLNAVPLRRLFLSFSPQIAQMNNNSRKIHAYRIKATCDSRFCERARRLWAENILFGTHRRIAETRSPLTGTRLPRTKDLFQLCHIDLEQNTHTHTHSHEDKAWDLEHNKVICLRDAGQESEIYWTIFLDKKWYSPKPANGPLQKGRNELSVSLVDCPFCGKIAFLEKGSGKFCTPTDHFGDSKMPGCCLGRVFVGVPVSSRHSRCANVALHLIGGFLLWAVNNEEPGRTTIRLCARCTLEESF